MIKPINHDRVKTLTGSKPFGAALTGFIEMAFGVNLKHEVECYRLLANRRITSRGKKETAKFLKALYNYAVKISLEYETVEPLGWTASDKSGFPKCITTFKKYLKSSNTDHRRAALTVLRQYETIFCEPEQDTVSITAPGPGPSAWEPLRDKWKEFLEISFKKLSPPVKDELMHMTARNGPNYGPAIMQAHIDALAINEDKELKTNIFNLYSLPGIEYESSSPIPRLEKKLKVFESTLALGEKLRHRLNRKPLHSRLQFLAAGGCKTRTIAIVDFFSQDALRPIHKWAYRFLAKLKTDGTYSHNRIAAIACHHTKMRDDSFCFDLTTATDRFPVFLQTEFLSVCLNEEIAQSWTSVISKRKFAVPGAPDSLEYACGQPMGALSSWAVFALTHHAIVEFCAYLEGIYPFRKYAIIGDDVAIFNRKVAARYEEILKSLEIPISKDKSISSYGSNSPSRGEIAKRFFLNGEELSPIPTGAIRSGWKDLLLFPNLVRLCQERGVKEFFSIPPVHQLSCSWYSAKKHKEVGALLFYPGGPILPLEQGGGNWNPWEQFSNEEIFETFKEVFKRRLTDKADRVYKELLIEFNDDPIWGGLMDDLYDPNLPLHPMSLMWGSIRNKISQSYLELKSTKDFDPFEIEFILDPLLRDYRRKSHRRTRLKGILVQRTLEELMTKDSGSPYTIR